MGDVRPLVPDQQLGCIDGHAGSLHEFRKGAAGGIEPLTVLFGQFAALPVEFLVDVAAPLAYPDVCKFV